VIAWLVLTLGAVAAAFGTTLAVGTAAVSRLELSRWVSQRLRGSELAAVLLAAPATVVGPASALAAGGVVLAGLGLAGILGEGSVLASAAILIAAMPVFLALVHSIPRAVGRRWAEGLMRAAAPWLERGARMMGALVPAPLRRGVEETRLAASAGAANPDEIARIAGVIAFTERPVREVMTPRTDIVAVEEETGLRDAALLFTESGYSRLPVFRESIDHIAGMVYVFDLLKVTSADRLPSRPILVVPESRRCADLLFEMQRERRHLAVVLDEFGGTAGIVTLEDLLEELVGEIFDETDDRRWPSGPEHELVEVDGTRPAEEVAARFGTTLPGGTETVGGLLAAAIGRIPNAGERIIIGDLEFDVLQATPTRVERVVVRPAGSTPITVHGAVPWQT
jgi:putative hemolysin